MSKTVYLGKKLRMKNKQITETAKKLFISKENNGFLYTPLPANYFNPPF